MKRPNEFEFNLEAKFWCGLTMLCLVFGMLVGFLGRVRGEERKTIETIGYQQYYSSNTVNQGPASSFTVTGILLSWDARVLGSTAAFHVSASTSASATAQFAGTYYALNQSSSVVMAAGDTVSDSFVRGQMINPIFYLESLGAGGTFYIDISYLKKKEPQDPVGWGN